MSSAHELRVDQGDVPAVVSGSACVWTSSLPEKRVFELESSCRPPLRYRLVGTHDLWFEDPRSFSAAIAKSICLATARVEELSGDPPTSDVSC